MDVALLVLAIVFAQPTTTAKERTAAEFRAYAAQKLSGLSDRKLDVIVERVDKNGDGVIGEEEFEQRTKVFREVKSGPEPWFTDIQKARVESAETGKPLLIFGRADWCPACQALEKETLTVDVVQQGLIGYVTLRLDLTDAAAFEEQATNLKIEAIPVMIVESGGKVVDRSLGVVGPKPLADWLDKNRRPSLRVLSYNIHHGEGVDGKLDLERIAKVILSTKPDIVALQEVDRLAARTGNVDQAKALAKLTKMQVAFGPNIKLGTGDYGNAVLSRFPIKVRKNHKLPNIDKGEQRGVLDVDIQTPAGAVRLLATHFDHRRPSEERERSARFVNELRKQSPNVPTLLAGDLNAVPKSKPLTLLSKHWQRPDGVFPTVPVKSPSRQIDFVLAARKTGAEVRKPKVVEEAVASDHRPLVVVVTVAKVQHDEVTAGEARQAVGEPKK